MVKGTQKKVIVIKDTKSGIFDEAYFIVKTSADNALQTCDMVSEANRIINCAITDADSKKIQGTKRSLLRTLWFSLGVLCACGIFACALAMLGYS